MSFDKSGLAKWAKQFWHPVTGFIICIVSVVLNAVGAAVAPEPDMVIHYITSAVIFGVVGLCFYMADGPPNEGPLE